MHELVDFVVPNISSGISYRVSKLHDGLLSQHGPKLLNCIPKYLRNISGCSVDSFKNKLDKFLQGVPDEPTIPGYTGGNGSLYGSNSLIDQSYMLLLFILLEYYICYIVSVISFGI